jgi:hypothetical protein
VEICRIDGLVHEAPAKGGEPLTAIEVGQMLPGVTKVGDRLSRLVRARCGQAGSARNVLGAMTPYTAGKTGNEGIANPLSLISLISYRPRLRAARMSPTEAPWTL